MAAARNLALRACSFVVGCRLSRANRLHDDGAAFGGSGRSVRYIGRRDGELAAAIGISWGITAPLVGLVSDTYGRRRVGLIGLALMASGILGSALAWSYWALLVCRLITGAGAAMIPPNSMAAIADQFPHPARRGTPISILLCASFFGVAIGAPAVAFLAELGG